MSTILYIAPCCKLLQVFCNIILVADYLLGIQKSQLGPLALPIKRRKNNNVNSPWAKCYLLDLTFMQTLKAAYIALPPSIFSPQLPCEVY